MTWTKERTARFCELHAQGVPFREIAAALGGMTVNACIGKAHRLGLVVRPARGHGGAVKNPKPKPVRQRAFKPLPEVPTLRFTAPIEEIASGSITLLDLKSHHCRWPEGDPILFCGAAKQDGSSYCAEHARIARRA